MSGHGSPGSAFVLPERALRLVRETRWLALAVLALFLLLILASYHPADPAWSHAGSDGSIRNAGGRVGAWLADLLLYLFGMSAYLIAGAMAVSVVPCAVIKIMGNLGLAWCNSRTSSSPSRPGNFKSVTTT